MPLWWNLHRRLSGPVRLLGSQGTGRGSIVEVPDEAICDETPRDAEDASILNTLAGVLVCYRMSKGLGLNQGLRAAVDSKLIVNELLRRRNRDLASNIAGR
jgi:hypothetical protein